jgi:hypothetical protein
VDVEEIPRHALKKRTENLKLQDGTNSGLLLIKLTQFLLQLGR